MPYPLIRDVTPSSWSFTQVRILREFNACLGEFISRELLDSGALNLPALVTRLASSRTITTTGNLDNLDVSGITVLRMNNASLATIRGLAAGYDGQTLLIESVGAGQVNLAHQNTNSATANRLVNSVTSGVTPLAAGTGRAIYVYDTTTARWRLVLHEQGAWIDVPYASGDFTADAGTFGVDSGDVQAWAFLVQDKTVTLILTLNTTSLSTTPTALQVAIPNGYTPVRPGRTAAMNFNGGASTTGMSRVVAADTTWRIYRDPAKTAWVAATNTTDIYAQQAFEVT